MGKAVSLAVKDLAKGLSLWKGGEATIRNPRFVIAAFGKLGDRTALQLTLELAEPYEGKDEIVERWGVGDPKNLQPSEDGTELEIVEGSKVTAPSDSSNYGDLITSLVNAGFDDEKLAEGSIDVIDGLKVVFGRKEQKDRGDLQAAPAREGQQKRTPPTVLVVNEILKGAKGGAKKKAAAADDDEKPAKTSKKPAADEDDDDSGGDQGERIAKVIRAVLKAAGKPQKTSAMTEAAFEYMDERKAEYKDRKELMAMLSDRKQIAKIAADTELFEFDADSKTYSLP